MTNATFSKFTDGQTEQPWQRPVGESVVTGVSVKLSLSPVVADCVGVGVTVRRSEQRAHHHADPRSAVRRLRHRQRSVPAHRLARTYRLPNQGRLSALDLRPPDRKWTAATHRLARSVLQEGEREAGSDPEKHFKKGSVFALQLSSLDNKYQLILQP